MCWTQTPTRAACPLRCRVPVTGQVSTPNTIYAQVETPSSSDRRPDGIGVVVPFDFALDDELWAYLPDGVRLHVTRTPAREGLIDADLVAAVSEEGVVAGGGGLVGGGPTGGHRLRMHHRQLHAGGRPESALFAQRSRRRRARRR